MTKPPDASNAPYRPSPPQAKAATLTVQRTVGGKTQAASQDLETTLFENHPAEVEALLGRTINLGNYESIRVQVGIRRPCYPEEVMEVLDHTTDELSEYMAEQEKLIKKAYGLSPDDDD